MIFVERPDKILQFMNANGYSGTYYDAVYEYFQQLSSLSQGTLEDHVNDVIVQAGFVTGTLQDKLTAFFVDATGISDRRDAERSFWQNTSNSFGGSNGLDEFTKLLLHCDGADGSTTITDATGRHTMGAVANAQLDTAQKKFGTASILFDGTDDAVNTPDSADWDIFASSTSDWTIDFWVKRSDTVSETVLFMQQREASTLQWAFYQFSSATGINFFMDQGTLPLNIVTNTHISDTNWHHLAFIKKGSDNGVYLDGTQIGYGSNTTTATFTAELRIGENGTSEFAGWMDEIRIQNSNWFNAAPNSGKTDTITVPTEAYS